MRLLSCIVCRFQLARNGPFGGCVYQALGTETTGHRHLTQGAVGRSKILK